MTKGKSIFGDAGSALMAAFVDFEGFTSRLSLYYEGLKQASDDSESQGGLSQGRVLELQKQIELAESEMGKIKHFLNDYSSGKSKKAKKKKTAMGQATAAVETKT